MDTRKGDSAAEKGHLPALDGVRGIAILAVLAAHLLFSNNISSSPIIQVLLDIRNQLWIGVTLFFSLSGFLITGILYDTLGTRSYFRTFYGRRVLRIFPLYYGFLGLLLVLTPVLHLNWQGQAYRLLTYTTNLPFTREWTDNPAPYISLRHFWSLAVEEQFYLLWPLIIFWLRDWKKVFTAALTGSCLALVLRSLLVVFKKGPENHSLPFCMDGLLLGGALALLVRSRYRQRTLELAPYVFVLAAAIILAASIHDPNLNWDSAFLTTIGMSIAAIGTTALVATALVQDSFAQKLFSFSPLRFFGTYSYGLYVYHYSLDAALTERLRFWFEAHGASKPEAILLAAFPILLLSIALAVASYQLYEKHFLRMKRFFPYRRPVLTEELAHH